MRNRRIRRLVSEVARTLAQYAHSIENYFAEDDCPDQQSYAATKLHDEPPAHWLEKVRQGAPHLLDQTTDVKQHDTAPSHDAEKQNSQSNSNYEHCQESDHRNKNFVYQSPDEINWKNLIFRIKKFLEPDLLIRLQSLNTEDSGSGNESIQPSNETIPTNANLPDGNPRLKKNTALSHSEVSAIDKQGNSRVEFQNLDFKDFQEIKFSTCSSGEFPPQHQFNEKGVKPGDPLVKQKDSTNPVIFHLHPHPKFQLEAKQHKGNSQDTNVRFDQSTDQLSSQEPYADTVESKKTSELKQQRNPDVPSVDYNTQSQPATELSTESLAHSTQRSTNISLAELQEETVESKKPDYAEFSWPDSPKYTGYKPQPANNSKRSSIKLNSHVGPPSNQRSIASSDITIQQPFNFPGWPNLPDEKKLAIHLDRWPKLPDQENERESEKQCFERWRQEDQMKRKFLTEQEQRGKLWNV